MKQNSAADSVDPSDEIVALVRTLHETQRRLQELTGGQVDAVLNYDGQSYLLHEAQEKLRTNEEIQRVLAATQVSILNALTAHVALLDPHGVIIAVNDGWRRFAESNGLQSSESCLGYNYLETCERTEGDCARDAHRAATGIREVLTGARKEFSLEYACHSPTERRWFHLMVTPLDLVPPTRAAVMHIEITDRKLIEEQLLSKTAMFEAQVRSSLDGILIIGSDYKKVLQNHRMVEIWGMPPEIAESPDYQVQLDWRAGVVKNPAEFSEKIAWLYGHPEAISREEVELLNGKILDRYSAPVRGEDGTYYGRIWIFRDITERKQAERRAEEQIQLMDMAARIGKLGAWALELPDRKLVWSEEVYRLHEVDPGYKPEIDAVSDFSPATRAKLRASIDSGQAFDLESEFLSARGNKKWIRTTGALEIRDGVAHRFYGLFQDITDQKRNESRFRRLVDSNAQGVFMWNANGAITGANDAFLKLVGYSREDLAAGHLNWTQMTPAEFAHLDQRAIDEIAATGVCQVYEKEWICKDGSRLPILLGAAIFEDNPEEGICFVLDLTARKRSESRFRRLVDSNAQGVMFWKSTGEITDGNDAFLRLVGYNREDLQAGRINWRALTPPEYLEADGRALEEIAARGFCEPLEKEWIRKDGSRVPVYLTAASFEDTPDQGVTFALDLTDRKRAERAQRLSEERFSHAFEYAPNGMILVAIEGQVITANRYMCDLIGYTLTELTQKQFSELTHPEDVAKELEFVRQMLTGQIHFYQLDKRYLHKQGHERWVHLSASLVRDANNEPLYFIKQVQDITEIKRAYQQIEEQAALIDEASDAIFTRDLEHRILFWSKGAQRLYGWTAEEALGRSAKDLLKIDSAQFAELEKGLFQAGQWSGEIQKQTKSGTPIVTNSRWTLLRDASGQPRSILTIDSDVTERKKLEQQFLRAQRMESIGTLAGGIAHDLNNILAPIMMSIDVLKSLTAETSEASEILETIRVSAKRGADIVRQVLSFARGVEGKRIEVQPKHIMEDVENIVKNTFPKSVQIRATIPRDIWTILGDPTQIHQILLNLCVNARDAMPNGGNLNLTAENFVLDHQYSVMSNEAKPGPYVQISVTDSGMGIPPELLERIFEPFFTTKEVNKGTGLGLSTVMAIVKSHEGIINVYSEVGKGTTFKVYLPAIESSPEKKRVQTQPVSLPRGNGETILVVDDEASILTITSQTLVAFGYRVLKATDGAEAVALYAEHKQDVAVVLTDMMMPVLDGSALIHALKRMNPAIKIIAASGLNAEGSVARSTDSSVNHFLSKPYTAGSLLKTLQEILRET